MVEDVVVVGEVVVVVEGVVVPEKVVVGVVVAVVLVESRTHFLTEASKCLPRAQDNLAP